MVLLILLSLYNIVLAYVMISTGGDCISVKLCNFTEVSMYM